MSLFIAVVYGKKARTRALGVRATFCPGCLEVRRVSVHAVEQADHVYLVTAGKWKEMVRYQECDVCRFQQQIPPEAAMIAPGEAEGRSPREILERTQSPPEVERLREAEKAAQSVEPAERKRRALRVFLARQAGELKKAEQDTGGWAGLCFLLFAGLGVAAFFLGGLAFGIAASVALLVLLFWLQSRLIHARAGAAIEPRVRGFLEGTGISWRELEEFAEDDPEVPGRLRRHFRRARYEPYRHGLS